jgi:hypothetical protein
MILGNRGVNYMKKTSHNKAVDQFKTGERLILSLVMS